jgi:hypothetical protein
VQQTARAPQQQPEPRLEQELTQHVARPARAADAARASEASPRRRAAGRRHGEQRAEDEQTIEVTIGRVELRAPAAPAQPVSAAPDPPWLSLDDYLRERDGGRRP